MAFRDRIFPAWIKLTSVKRKPRRLFTDRGRIIQTSAVICGVIGLDTDMSYTYQLFALLICLLIASRLCLRFQIPEISVSRELPRYATVGKSFDYYLTVINEGQRVERDLDVTDNPEVIHPDLEQFQSVKEPGEETRNIYDRWIGWHRFIWLQRLKTGVTINKSKVSSVAVKGTAKATMTATPLRRGIVNFESTTVLHPDPFALSYGTIQFENPEQIIVLPKSYPVSKNFEYLAQNNFQPATINSSWSIGDSDEFVSLRDYRDGDPIRKIHWSSTAKRNQPVVKEFQNEFSSRQTLVVDTFLHDEEIFEEVVSVATSLLRSRENKKGLLDLCFMADRAEIITAGFGSFTMSQQLEALAILEKTSSPPDELIQSLIARSGMMSSCIMVLAGTDPNRQKIIRAIESRGIPTAIFVLKHPTDNTPMRKDYRILEIGQIKEELSNL